MSVRRRRLGRRSKRTRRSSGRCKRTRRPVAGRPRPRVAPRQVLRAPLDMTRRRVLNLWWDTRRRLEAKGLRARMRARGSRTQSAWHKLLRALAVACLLLLALAFASASSARSKAHEGTPVGKAGRVGVPRLGRIIPQRLPPFIAYDDGSTGIFLMKPDGSDSHSVGPAEPLPSDPYPAEEPSWSPNGRKILYSTGCGIWVMNADGGHQHPLVPVGAKHPSSSSSSSCGSLYVLGQPRWSPNGKKIIYLAQGQKGGPLRWGLHIANADGSDVHFVPHTAGALGAGASFSPDGRYIVFAKVANWKPHIYLIRPNGTGLRQLNTGQEADEPSWSPTAHESSTPVRSSLTRRPATFSIPCRSPMPSARSRGRTRRRASSLSRLVWKRGQSNLERRRQGDSRNDL